MLFRAGELRAGDYSSGYAAATSHAAAAAGQPLLFASTMPAGRQCADSTRNEQNSAAAMTSENVLVRTLPAERATKTGFAANTLTSQTDSMYGDSVKYYVLENSKQPTYGNVLD